MCDFFINKKKIKNQILKVYVTGSRFRTDFRHFRKKTTIYHRSESFFPLYFLRFLKNSDFFFFATFFPKFSRFGSTLFDDFFPEDRNFDTFRHFQKFILLQSIYPDVKVTIYTTLCISEKHVFLHFCVFLHQKFIYKFGHFRT